MRGRGQKRFAVKCEGKEGKGKFVGESKRSLPRELHSALALTMDTNKQNEEVHFSAVRVCDVCNSLFYWQEAATFVELESVTSCR